MKNTKILLISLIALTLTFAGGIAMYSTMSDITPMDLVIYSAVAIIVLFSIVTVLKRFKDEKKGLVAEDELSVKIKQKAAASAFTGSIYLWTMILIFTIDTNLSHEHLLGIGIVGMGLVFVVFWIYYNNKGIESENAH